ncbi:MAG TPA: rod shape-determining protein MreC [Gammaproteobacteria bacterium]|jgi:rod shape-determining protein MreC|nr:rod shape-determining protein MreC [Gammaproteobacteria bacterium]
MFASRQRAPALFSSNPAGTLRTLLLVIACIALMFYDHQRGRLEHVHAALSALVYPVQVAVDAPYALAGWAREKLATHMMLVNENAALKQQELKQALQLQRLGSLEQENTRLRSLMGASKQVPGRVMVAEMLGVDLDPFRHRVIINKGTADGVFDGQTLLDAQGIVGQVIRTDPISSEVAFITDPSQAIQVEISRTGLRTLVVGTADVNTLSLPFLANNADVQVGDILVSSGLGGRYPKGYPVGVVRQVIRNPAESFATVTAQPSADLNHGHNVLLYFPVETPTPLAKPEPRTDKKTEPHKASKKKRRP